jgi:hypothetical protein
MAVACRGCHARRAAEWSGVFMGLFRFLERIEGIE